MTALMNPGLEAELDRLRTDLHTAESHCEILVAALRGLLPRHSSLCFATYGGGIPRGCCCPQEVRAARRAITIATGEVP